MTCLVHSTGAQTSWTTCLFLLDPVRLLPVRARVTVRSPLRAQRSTTVLPPDLLGHLNLALTAVTSVTLWNLDFTVRSFVKDLLGLSNPTRHLGTTRALRSRPTGHAIFTRSKKGAVFLGDLMT